MQKNVDAMVQALVTDPQAVTPMTAPAAPRDRATRRVRRDGAASARRRRRSRSRRGSIHVLVGPNGAGKSTLLAAVLGQRRVQRHASASTGAARAASATCRRRFAVDRTLPLTVGEFLALSRQRRPVCLGVAARDARSASRRCSRASAWPASASRPLGAALGRRAAARAARQRASIRRRSCCCSTSRRAGSTRRRCGSSRTMLARAARSAGTSVLMVSHDLAQVRRVADRVTLLDRAVRAQRRAGEGAAPATCAASLALDAGYARVSALYDWLAALADARRAARRSSSTPSSCAACSSVLLLAPLLGGMSHLVVARRLAFFSAALGQAALTGLTIGLVLGEPLNARVRRHLRLLPARRRSAMVYVQAPRVAAARHADRRLPRR